MEDKSSGSRGSKRFDGPFPFLLAQVKVGDEYDVKIESMSRRGDSGVAKIQGLVVFVSGAKIGDSVTIRITKIGSGFALGEVVGKSDAAMQKGDTEASGEIDE